MDPGPSTELRSGWKKNTASALALNFQRKSQANSMMKISTEAVVGKTRLKNLLRRSLAPPHPLPTREKLGRLSGDESAGFSFAKFWHFLKYHKQKTPAISCAFFVIRRLF